MDGVALKYIFLQNIIYICISCCILDYVSYEPYGRLGANITRGQRKPKGLVVLLLKLRKYPVGKKIKKGKIHFPVEVSVI